MADHDTHDHTGVTGVPSATAPNPTTIELGHASDTTLSRASAGNVSIEGNAIYRAGGTDVPLADGGTGASLSDPNADRILFWDDSAGGVTWLTAGTNLTITGTSIAASGGGSGITPGQTVSYPSAFSGDTIDGSSTAPFVDVAAFDTKEVLNSRVLHLQTLGASKTQNVRVTLGTTKAAAFDVRICAAFTSGAWTSTDNSTYFEVRGSTTGDAQLFACRWFPFNNGGTPRILGHVLKIGSTSMAAVNDNLDPHVRSTEPVTLRFVRDGSDVLTPYFGIGNIPVALSRWQAASDHTPKTFSSDSGTLARIEFKIVTPSGPGSTVPFDAYIDYIASV